MHTFVDLGEIPTQESWTDFLYWLQEREKKGITNFANEYQALSIDKLEEAFLFWEGNSGSMMAQLKTVTTSEEALKLVRKIPHAGAFYGAKIVLLLRDIGVVTCTDRVALLGNGSTAMIRWLYPGDFPPGRRIQKKRVRQKLLDLFDQLSQNTATLGYTFHKEEDLENALCEFHKWMAATNADYRNYWNETKQKKAKRNKRE